MKTMLRFDFFYWYEYFFYQELYYQNEKRVTQESLIYLTNNYLIYQIDRKWFLKSCFVCLQKVQLTKWFALPTTVTLDKLHRKLLYNGIYICLHMKALRLYLSFGVHMLSFVWTRLNISKVAFVLNQTNHMKKQLKQFKRGFF